MSITYKTVREKDMYVCTCTNCNKIICNLSINGYYGFLVEAMNNHTKGHVKEKESKENV